MMLPDAVDRLDWAGIAAQLDAEGWAMLPGLVGTAAARCLVRQIHVPDAPGWVPLTGVGPRAGDPAGLAAALPAPWGAWHRAFHRHLWPIADGWNERLGIGRHAPPAQDACLPHPGGIGQLPLPCHVSRLRAGDHTMLRQHGGIGAAGELMLPLQVVALLSAPGEDFLGGEFVLTQQRPRMQSRPMVLPLQLGDAAVIATAQHPCRGARGDYRVTSRHAISRVHAGERISAVLSFHAARPAAGEHDPATGPGRRAGRAG